MSLRHCLLGLLHVPRSGYALKKAFDDDMGHLWRAELSQIYPTLRKLEEEGLLTSVSEDSPMGPDRRVYTRTEEGRRELHDWLREPLELPEPRFGFLAKLFFLWELGDLEQTAGYLKMLRQGVLDRLGRIQDLEVAWMADHPGYPDDLPDREFHYLLTLRRGQLAMNANRQWIDECLMRVEERLEGRRRGNPEPTAEWS
jgi:DNA-binding PadR family transcriptional regulator